MPAPDREITENNGLLFCSEKNMNRTKYRKHYNHMKILNFGSINIDFVYEVPHFVAPGETMCALSRHCFPGGKGANQSVA